MEGSPVTKKNSFDFSIESLLKTNSNQSHSDCTVGINSRKSYFTPESLHESGQVKDLEFDPQDNKESGGGNDETFSWLNCTRFKPPKLPRSKKRCNSTKRFGRGPRIPFSPQQISILEQTFSNSQYLSSDNILDLAKALHLTETRVKIWFQNRRARYRREKDGQPNCPSTGLHETPNYSPSSSQGTLSTKDVKSFKHKSSDFLTDLSRPLTGEVSKSPVEQSSQNKTQMDNLLQQRSQTNFLPTMGKYDTIHHDSSSLLYSKDFHLLSSSESSKMYFFDYLRRHNSDIYAMYQQPILSIEGRPSLSSTLSPNFHRDPSSAPFNPPPLIHTSSPHLTIPYVALHE